MSAARSLSIARIYREHAEKLGLRWIVAQGIDREVELADHEVFGPDVVGHFNLIYSHRIQVIGNAERRWIARVGEADWRRQVEMMMAARPPAIIVADDYPPSEMLTTLCERHSTPLFVTPKPCSMVIDALHLYLARELADNVSMHGVFMDVYGIGVLITGDAGIGKSELALELISRGHGLVADDIVDLSHTAPNTLEGRCPPMLRDYLEVRGLGMLNIRTIFGEAAARRKKRLRLIVHLQRQVAVAELPRLPLEAQSQEILGVSVRKVTFHVAPGRNLAVLLEAAVLNHILQLRGIDSMGEFISRQQQALRDGQDGR